MCAPGLERRGREGERQEERETTPQPREVCACVPGVFIAEGGGVWRPSLKEGEEESAGASGIVSVFLKKARSVRATASAPAGCCVQNGMREADMEGVGEQVLMDGQRNAGGAQQPQQQQQYTACSMATAEAGLRFLKPAGFIQHKKTSCAREDLVQERRASVGSSRRRRRGASARTLAAGLALTLAACSSSTPAYG